MRVHVAVVALLAVVALGCSSIIGSTPFSSMPKASGHLEVPKKPSIHVRTGQARATCAERNHREFEAPHRHAVFFIDLVQGRTRGIEAGDTVKVSVEERPDAFVTFAGLTGAVLTFEFPAGLGEHSLKVEWRDASGALVAAGESGVAVYNCLAA